MAGGSKRRKRNMLTTNIGTLPKDIIFNILVRVPAQDIFNAAKIVCRTWCRMIRTRVFVHAHLQQSTHGLLVQDNIDFFDSRHQPTFIETPKGQIKTSNFYCEFTRGVLSSCNGLVLEGCEKNNHCRDLYITNPSTKQHFALPSFPFYHCTRPECCAIAYAAADMVYKVVGLFFSHRTRKIKCAILTVGVDKDWGRLVNTQHLTHVDARSSFHKFIGLKRTLTTQGFVHWTSMHCSDFFSLNVETEVITQFSVPAAASRRDDGRCYHYFAMGSNLSLLISLSGWSWEVWEMRPETGVWTQMPNIDLVLSFGYIFIQPVGWSNFREVLLFHVDSFPDEFNVAYNVRTQEVVSTELDLHLGGYYLAHKNTLLWF